MLALDLFCGGGGACLGLQRAGFEVVGIDIKPRKNYPGEFIEADLSSGELPVDRGMFDFIWASPPCQEFSIARGSDPAKEALDLIPVTRKMLEGHPFTCIENVAQSPLRQDLTLWGPQFGLGPTEKIDGLWRKRVFELSFFCWQLPRPRQERGRYISITGSLSAPGHYYRRKAKGLPGRVSKNLAKHVMGIPLCSKMTCEEIGNAVPPAYAEYIGKSAKSRLKAVWADERRERYRAAMKIVFDMEDVPF